MCSPYSVTKLGSLWTILLATTGVSKVALIIPQPLTVREGTSKLSLQTGVAHSIRNTHMCRGYYFCIDNHTQVQPVWYSKGSFWQGLQGKAVPVQAMKANRGKRGTVLLYSFLTWAINGVECSTSRPGRFVPRKTTPYPLNRRLGGTHSRSGRLRARAHGRFLGR